MATAPPSSDPLLPKGRYVVVRELGRGGMGVVYQAHDTLQDRHVALKVCNSDPVVALMEGRSLSGSDRLRRFRREASFAGLVHPNVIRIYDYGIWDGDGERAFAIVQELVHGVALHEALRSRRFPEGAERSASRARLLADFLRVCEGIAYAHDKGVVHRDVKPANILLVGDYTRARIVDFGLAKWLGRPEPAPFPAAAVSAAISSDGLAVGTPQYMSPEQAQGALERVDVRSDVWALGIVLFEILTHEIPWGDADASTVLTRVCSEAVPAPNDFLAAIPEPRRCADPIPRALESIIDRCLQRDPADRYPNARALLADLDSWLHSPQGALGLQPPAGRRRFKPGELIAGEGEPSTTMYVLEEGRGAVVIEKAGWQQSCREGFFGEAALVRPGAPRTATLRAGPEGCELIEVRDEAALLKLLQECPRIGIDAMKELHARRVVAEDFYVKKIAELETRRTTNPKSQT